MKHRKYLVGIIKFIALVSISLANTQSILYPTQNFARITTGKNPQTPKHPPPPEADYSRKVSVRVSDVLTRQRAAEAASYQIRPPDGDTKLFTKPSDSIGTASQTQKNSALPMAQIVVRPQNSPPASALVVPMANMHNVIKGDRSWPPDNSQEFARVDVRVMGERMDSVALLHLRPSSSADTTRKLRKILGSDLQPQWMSVDPPPKEPDRIGRSSVITMSMPQKDDRLVKAVGELNFTVLRPAPGSDMLAPVEMPPEQIELVKEWLIQRASCRLDYIWEDLGPLFWPRWIRRGICMNAVACSWPPGMMCRPSGSRQLKILRWVCKNDSALTDEEARRRRRRHQYPPYYQRSRREVFKRRRRIPREERRSRRVRRLIRKLSLSANGYYCEWRRHEYVVSDKCACGCE